MDGAHKSMAKARTPESQILFRRLYILFPVALHDRTEEGFCHRPPKRRLGILSLIT